MKNIKDAGQGIRGGTVAESYKALRFIKFIPTGVETVGIDDHIRFLEAFG